MSEPVILNKYAIVKLSSGEMLACTLAIEDSLTLTVSFPMEITVDLIYDEEGNEKEKTVIIPFCPFTQERLFKLNKMSIIFVEAMKVDLHGAYTGLVDYYENQMNGKEPGDVPKIKKFLVEGNDTLN